MVRPSQQSIQRIRVLVADSSPMASQLLAGALMRCHNRFDVVVGNNYEDAIRQLSVHRPHVAALNVELQDGPKSGFRILSEIRTSQRKTAAVIMIPNCNRELVIEAFRAGARGVFCRIHPLRTLAKCIRKVHAGQVWAGNEEIEFLIEAVSLQPALYFPKTDGMPLLTRREEQIVHLATEGLKNYDIAQRLQIREHTVRNYFCHIFDKLGVSSRVELILYATSRHNSN